MARFEEPHLPEEISALVHGLPRCKCLDSFWLEATVFDAALPFSSVMCSQLTIESSDRLPQVPNAKMRT